jgi:hypothetical protein
MLYRLIMGIAVIGLAHEAAAADIDTTYLRGTGPTYQVQQLGYPWYPTGSGALLACREVYPFYRCTLLPVTPPNATP